MKIDWFDAFLFVLFVSVITYCTYEWGWRGFVYASGGILAGSLMGWHGEPFFPRHPVQALKGLLQSLWRNTHLAVLALVLALSLLLLTGAFVAGFKTELRAPPEVFGRRAQ